MQAVNSEVADYCANCNLNVGIPKASFCPRCGEKLQPPRTDTVSSVEKYKTAKTGVRSAKAETAKTCMICHETVSKNDYVDWCPFCGQPAHRTELEKWLRSKRSCPSCNESLTEKQLQEAAVTQVGSTKGASAVSELLVHRGHTISIAGKKILYDGKEVSSSGEISGTMSRLTFAVEEEGKPAQYDLRVDVQKRGIPGLGLISPLANLAVWASGAYAGMKFAVLRNGKFIYNQGIVIMSGSRTMKDIKADLKSKGIEPGQEIQCCPNCGAENTLLDPFFCACCGASLSNASKDVPSAIGRGKADRNSRTCFVCGKGLSENLKKGETMAWCPFCGKPAHTRCLYDALKQQNKCPSCGNSLYADDFVHQLKKRKKK